MVVNIEIFVILKTSRYLPLVFQLHTLKAMTIVVFEAMGNIETERISSIKKFGNHNIGINVSIETGGVETIDNKGTCNAFSQTSAEMSKYSGDFS